MPIEEMPMLFFPETCYVLDKPSQTDVLSTVSADLLHLDLVTEGFLPNLLKREEQYPTGMDMSPLGEDVPNIACPHTETEFVKVTRIVPVKLIEPLAWHNMLDPERELNVSFLFMILNADKEAQTGLLAAIMDFVNKLGADGLKEFCNLVDSAEIFSYLCKHF